ncbi:hypothetical protein [Cystobacter fuscus]|uniref:hypothetical protein n=1 Tax=Cystobacter fuscus TaxID=43 RepID=UPI002B311CBD|nr:hypothetical protein F0U63_32060 [Cystobacter fuscus]
MAVELIHLGGSPEELEAALGLRRRRNVHVQVEPEAVPHLRATGFVEAPEAVNAFVELPYDGARRSHNLRRSIGTAVERWEQAEVSLELHDVSSYGLERLIEEFYFPILVRHLYTRGLSPFGAHNLEAFRQIARPDTYVVMATRDGKVAGGGLLRRRAGEPLRSVRGPLPTGPWVEGLVYALAPVLDGLQRAFLYALTEIFSAEGFSHLSFGRDLPYAEPRYSGVLLEKLRWADCIAVHEGARRHLYAFHEESLSDSGLLLLEQCAEGLAARALGRVFDNQSHISRLLARRAED